MDRHTFITQVKKGLQGQKTINGKAILAMIIFGAIILTFVLSDLTGKKGGGLGVGSAAEVNGEIITLKEFKDQESRVSAYYAQFFGGKATDELQRRQIVSDTLNELINSSLASQGAEKEKIFATDLELKKIITEDLPYFKKDGVFQSDLYKGLLQANRMTPSEFEKGLRQQAKTQKVRQLFELALAPSTLEKQLEKELKSKQLNVAYIKLNAQSIKDAQVITQSEVNTNLANEQFAQKVKNYYETNKAEFESPEQVKTSHILIRAETAEALPAAKLKAEEVLKRLEKEDFAKLAAQLSEDPGSKDKKGDLGYITRGKTIKEFEDAAFALPVGKVSGLVQTAFGYHIIKVSDKKAAAVTSLEQARVGIAQKLLADEKYLALAKALETALGSNNIDAINKTLAESKLKWTETGYFDLTTEQLPVVNSNMLFKASMELSKNNPYSRNLVREGDAQYLLKLVDVKTVEIKEDIKLTELSQRQKASSGYVKWVTDLRKSAKISTNNGLFQ